jgi:hypothetical protein
VNEAAKGADHRCGSELVSLFKFLPAGKIREFQPFGVRASDGFQFKWNIEVFTGESPVGVNRDFLRAWTA